MQIRQFSFFPSNRICTVREMPAMSVAGILITSVVYLHTDEERTRLSGAVEITRIAETAFIKVALERIEDVLHASVELQFDMILEHEGVVELKVHVEERRRMHHLVARDVLVGVV